MPIKEVISILSKLECLDERYNVDISEITEEEVVVHIKWKARKDDEETT